MSAYPNTYQYPFFGAYDVDRNAEPTDAEALMLMRALAHYCAAYASDNVGAMTVADLVSDLLESNGFSDPAATRDECVAIAAATGARA